MRVIEGKTLPTRTIYNVRERLSIFDEATVIVPVSGPIVCGDCRTDACRHTREVRKHLIQQNKLGK